MIKSALKKIITGTFEVVKDSAGELGKTISPAEMMNQLAGTQQPPEKSEMGEYLEKVGDPTLTGDKLEARKKELKTEEERQLEEARRAINPNPAHMRPLPRERVLTPYEQRLEDDQKKKEAEVAEAQRQSQTLAMPKGKAKGKLGSTSHKATTEGLKKDSKFG
ncbi:hypothetical protein A3D03_05940 [Candidatus Gottesmanbacteria bacterium RIFCSPHIGHO2_02_FULL_40_13]|uniref:Uncharacterized protein n=1 Tax=Candidatus Gottesmanbacteria bacterium RIFCSPHIGHO2_02_FULL_40_13 TaxID=1798384 RepID=A0A1F6A6K7_9BACT|nr:MAG: hypothetical protein A3D03_05940 [Candidatus Gottesmanbacteria bacterium RIFCSPHIGHO2_02_FULL_40_13]